MWGHLVVSAIGGGLRVVSDLERPSGEWSLARLAGKARLGYVSHVVMFHVKQSSIPLKYP